MLALVTKIDTWAEYQHEDELLQQWAYWVSREPFIRGHGSTMARQPGGGREPWSDDIILPIDRAIAGLIPIYKHAIKRWYLSEIRDHEYMMRAALADFRAAYQARPVEMRARAWA